MGTAVLRPPVETASACDVVLAVRATGQEPLRAALRRLADRPDVLDRVRRVVVIDAGTVPSSTVLQQAVRLRAGLLRVVRLPDATAPEALSLGLLEALEEPASDVLVVDDTALEDPAVLSTALERRSPGAAVVGLRDPRAADPGPLSWWGALLPLDAVRAVGAGLPEAGAVALADLVLRAEAAGFRSAVLDASGPVPVVAEGDRLLLALLHGTADALRGVLREGVAEDLRLLLRFRARAVGERRERLHELLSAAGEERSALPRLRLALAGPALRRRLRTAALERASEAAWTQRLDDRGMNGARQRAERAANAGRPAAVRLPAWSTTRRTSAA